MNFNVALKMYNKKEKFQMDYSTFKTEVSKRRRSAIVRELSKITLTTLLVVTIESFSEKEGRS